MIILFLTALLPALVFYAYALVNFQRELRNGKRPEATWATPSVFSDKLYQPEAACAGPLWVVPVGPGRQSQQGHSDSSALRGKGLARRAS